jgi:hypothetical protein
MGQRITTEDQQKGLVKLFGYDFQIEYKKGGENGIVKKWIKYLYQKKKEMNKMVKFEPSPSHARMGRAH